MKIKNEKPPYISGTPIAVSLNDIKHISPHFHESAMEFIYCISGDATLTIAHENITISQGELVLIEHENIHTIDSIEGALLLSIHIDLKKVSVVWEEIRYMYFSCATALCPSHQKKFLENVCETILNIAYMAAATEKYSADSFHKAAEYLIDIIINNFSWFSIEDFSPEDNAKYRNRLNRILKTVQLRYMDKLTLSQIAKDEFINENYFSQFIKRTSFNSFTYMLSYVWCFEAEKLLVNSSLSIEDISDLCGFSSKKYFHKYFKHFWETTPLQRRKWYKSQCNIQYDYTVITGMNYLSIIQKSICDFNLNKLIQNFQFHTTQ